MSTKPYIITDEKRLRPHRRPEHAPSLTPKG